MYTRAVVATDLGPASEGIVACAGSLRALGIVEAFLVYAIDLEHGPSPEQDAAFARQAESLEGAGITVHVETPLGYAPHAITSLAAQRSADLIVMGTHGSGLYHTGFSGSVSSDVIRLSPAPVLLAPASVIDSASSGEHACARLLSSVLVAIDIDAAPEPLCDLVCGMAPTQIGRLELLHVVPMSFAAVREGREGKARAQLDEFAAQARSVGVNQISVTIARGAPDEIVPAYVRSGNFSLLVMAPGCQETIDQTFGSVTNAVIRGTDTPVLLAPPHCDPLHQGRGNT